MVPLPKSSLSEVLQVVSLTSSDDMSQIIIHVDGVGAHRYQVNAASRSDESTSPFEDAIPGKGTRPCVPAATHGYTTPAPNPSCNVDTQACHRNVLHRRACRSHHTGGRHPAAMT